MAGASQRPGSGRPRGSGASDPRRTAPARVPRSPVARLRLPHKVRVSGRALFGTAAALVLVGAGTGFFAEQAVLGALTTSGALAGLGLHPEADQNILLMGLDSRKDMNGNDLPAAILGKLHAGSSSDVGGYNTNTLILLHVPADGSQAVALSIPRDDYVDLPDHLGKHKIKEAYGRAKAAAEQEAHDEGVTDPAQLEHLGREAGRQAAIEAVQDLLGVQVDHFAEINLAGFYDLANALGGVTVCLRQPAHDDYSGADFPAGVQTLDGQQALAFVRQRHNLAGGDLDRTHRQQAFLASAVAKLDAAGVFGDLGRLGALLDVAHRDVVVDAGFDPLAVPAPGRRGHLGERAVLHLADPGLRHRGRGVGQPHRPGPGAGRRPPADGGSDPGLRLRQRRRAADPAGFAGDRRGPGRRGERAERAAGDAGGRAPARPESGARPARCARPGPQGARRGPDDPAAEPRARRRAHPAARRALRGLRARRGPGGPGRTQWEASDRDLTEG